MDSPRTRSENRAVRGYGIQSESRKNPDGFRANRNPGRDGLGRGGFRKSRRPWPKRKLDDTISAAYHASAEDKERAQRASGELRTPFAYNACLNLIVAGTEPLPDAIRAEAQKIAEANDAHYSRTPKAEAA